MSRIESFIGTWGAPLAFALLSAVGLVAGLLADGIWDWVSWLCLGSVGAACAWYGLLSSKRTDERT